MKKKLLAAMCAATMVFAMGTMAMADDEVKATGEEKIALITMDSIDQHWISLNEGAQKAAEEFGCNRRLHVPEYQGRCTADRVCKQRSSRRLSVQSW